MNYTRSKELLTSKGRFRIELGLERISKILELLNNPQNDFKIIHVAGTNGKGSVCAVSAKILECAGYKTALYTSPHLIEYTERIKINSVDISREDFSFYIELVVSLADKNKIDLTEFEILTAAAFKYFSDNLVEYALIETGMGGRFDATNASEHKLLTCITSISIDHKDKLGDTIEKIAFEKAGIMRSCVPVVVSEQNKGFGVIKEQAERINSKLLIPREKVEILYENNCNYAVFNGKKYEFSLLGDFQKENLGLVFEIVKYLKIDEKALEEGLKSVVWNSRFQFIKDKNLLIDGAHNEDGAKLLRKSLDYYFPKQKRVWIFGSMNTKEYYKTSKILFSPDEKIYFYRFNDSRTINIEDLRRCVSNPIEETDEEGIEKIINQNDDNTLKIACGSFYVTGVVLNCLKLHS